MTAKMLLWSGCLLLVGSFLLVAQPTTAADEKPDELTPQQVIEEVTNAYKLAEFGRKHGAPEALVAAGSVLRSLKSAKLGTIKEEPKLEDGDKSEVVEAKSFE